VLPALVTVNPGLNVNVVAVVEIGNFDVSALMLIGKGTGSGSVQEF
jgi:hypothetical protein